MNKYLLSILLPLMLTSCNALNFQAKPDVEKDCQYTLLPGTEFKFNSLADNQDYRHVFVAQSKESATLSDNYQDMRGKLTGKIITRNYPKTSVWGHRPSSFRDSLLYDDGYEDLYLTPKQQAIRDRKAKYVFQQAILENCQIVYISVDSLASDISNPKLIENSDVTIINNNK